MSFFIIAAIVSIVAFILVNLVFHDCFFGTVVPVIVSTVIGFICTAGAITIICMGNYKSATFALFMGLFMLARAYVEFRTMMFLRRW